MKEPTRSRTLAEALPEEMARVRALIIEYRSPILKGAGDIVAMMMEASLQRADKAVMDGDTVAMLQAYEDLNGYEL